MRHPVDKIESGTVWTMWQNGIDYSVMPDEQAPDVYDVGSDSDDGLLIDSILPWFTVTHGMTGQCGYNGPVMHDSEFISQRMMDDILAQYDYRTHYFVWEPVRYEDGDYQGWVILARETC